MSRLRLIKQPDLEQALLVLPFHYVQRLIGVLIQLVVLGLDTELPARSAVFLVKCHFNAIVSTHSLQPEIETLTSCLRGTIGQCRSIFGQNVAALKFIQNAKHENQQVFVGDTASDHSRVAGADGSAQKKKKKRKSVS